MRDFLSVLRGVAFVTGPTAILGITISTGTACAQSPNLAPEGRGLLAQPAEAPTELGGVPPPHVFARDASGVFSRDLFQTSEDPGFNIVIRDYSFPPDKQKHQIALPSGAFAHLISGPGDVTIANNRKDLRLAPRISVPANAPIEITNNGEEPTVVRMLIVEPK
jgi:quercetin dioxygenase-like cupin family protein